MTHPLTHAPKAICPINFFKVGGIKISFSHDAAHIRISNSIILIDNIRYGNRSENTSNWYVFMENKQKLSFNYHQIPSLHSLLVLKCWIKLELSEDLTIAPLSEQKDKLVTATGETEKIF